jgi:hypothetical protein
VKLLPQIPDLMGKRAAFLLFNFVLVGYLWFTGRIQRNWPSVIGFIFALTLMNVVAWWSSRNFPQWAKPAVQPDRDEAQPARKAIDTRTKEQ